MKRPKESLPVKSEGTNFPAPKLADEGRDLVTVRHPVTKDELRVKPMYVNLYVKKHGYALVEQPKKEKE